MNDLHEGAIAREELVEGVVNRFAPAGADNWLRFKVFGAARVAVLETVEKIGQDYPQLSDRICAKFGMSGWNK